MRTRIKICGLTSHEDALLAVNLGADALGFIFAQESLRCLTPEKVAAITTILPPFVLKIGVFKDQDPKWIKDVVKLCKLHIIQLHGKESPEYCKALGIDYIKAFRIKDEKSLDQIRPYCESGRKRPFLLDTFVPNKSGGTGRVFDWKLAHFASKYGPIILSGGLSPENIAQAILQVRPFAVDVSSGLEIAPGKKDINKMKTFIEEVYKTDRSIYKKAKA